MHDTISKTSPSLLQAWVGEDITPWITRDQRDVYNAHYGVKIDCDPDYTGALFAANAQHTPLLRMLFPTGEMFHPISKVLFKVSACLALPGLF